MSENILLVTDKDTDLSSVTKKLSRENDKISVTCTKNLKKYLSSESFDAVILHSENNEETLKYIETIKKYNYPIILALEEEDPEFILQAYDNGIFDYFMLTDESYKIMIKLVNCFKFGIQQEINKTNKLFLENFNTFDTKYNMYKLKHLKEIFANLDECNKVRKGFMCLITLEEDTKTKISLNRLAGIINKSVRHNDICAVNTKDWFYVLLKNTNLEGAKSFVAKIQCQMGQEFKIRSGLSKIGIQNFEELDKELKNNLQAALKNDEMYFSLSDIQQFKEDEWLDDTIENSNEKHFKLFTNAFEKKLKFVIEPLFFRFQKEYSSRLPNTKVNQYANNIECVFSLKSPETHSELIIRYDGFTKLNIEITHSGLNTPDTSKFDISINKFNERELIKYIKQLKKEHTEFS